MNSELESGSGTASRSSTSPAPTRFSTAWAREGERADQRCDRSAAAKPIRCSARTGCASMPDVALATMLGPRRPDRAPRRDTRPLEADDGFLRAHADLAGAGTLMTSVCTGGSSTAKAGLLDGRPATTHWSSLEPLAELGVEVDPDARFVDDGDVVTAAGSPPASTWRCTSSPGSIAGARAGRAPLHPVRPAAARLAAWSASSL